MSDGAYHLPVLPDAVADLAAGCTRAVDGTTGGGGHTRLLRDGGAAVLAVDRDPEALAAARAALGEEGITWVTGAFADPDVLARVADFQPDFILLDLGVSSHQLDADHRGFSFRPGVPLDMRMTPGQGPSAAELLNHLDESALADLFHRYGDERRARRLARAVGERRARAPFVTSDDLVAAIRRAGGARTGPADFARIFQAVRMAVNEEPTQLETALPALRDALGEGGTLAVIAYHSGEDRAVKHAFREWARSCVCPPRQPVCTCRGRPLGTVRTRRPITPSATEVAANPRARSARLRAFRTGDGG